MKAGQNGPPVEIVQLEYNPHVIETKQIIEIFFYLQDFGEKNGRKGGVITGECKSTIFYHDIDQKTVSENAIDQLLASGRSGVVQLKPIEKFYPVESELVDYCAKHPEDEFCRTVVKPKIERLSSEYKELLKPQKSS